MLDCYKLILLSLSLALSIIIIIIIIIIVINSTINAISKEKEKQRGGREVLLIKQCEHVYMHVIFIITFLFVCLLFVHFLVENIFF